MKPEWELVQRARQGDEASFAALVERLGPGETAAVGNGRNDVDMLRAAGLSLAVIGDEGAFSGALLAAHVVCRNITEALDLLLLPHRLKASLRG